MASEWTHVADDAGVILCGIVLAVWGLQFARHHMDGRTPWCDRIAIVLTAAGAVGVAWTFAKWVDVGAWPELTLLSGLVVGAANVSARLCLVPWLEARESIAAARLALRLVLSWVGPRASWGLVIRKGEGAS